MYMQQKRQRLKHVNFRLSEADFEKLEKRAQDSGCTISEEVRLAMNRTIHLVQTDRLSMSAVMYCSGAWNCTRKLDVKIHAQTYEYIKFNQLNLSAVLRFDLQYAHDY